MFVSKQEKEKERLRERERGHGYKKMCVTFKTEVSHHVSCDSRGLEIRRVCVCVQLKLA